MTRIIHVDCCKNCPFKAINIIVAIHDISNPNYHRPYCKNDKPLQRYIDDENTIPLWCSLELDYEKII